MSSRYPRLITGASRVTLWHRFSEVTVNDAGNPILVLHDTSQSFGHYAYQSAATNGSQSSQIVRLLAGSWAMSCLYYKNNLSGKMQMYWLSQADSSFGTIGAELDMYGATTYNQIHTGTFTIPMTGDYRITWSNTGKNALASDYRMGVTVTELWRTGN